MLANERMQPPRVRPATGHRFEKAGQRLHGLDPAHRVVRAQHLVEQRRVHPLEEPGVKDELAILRIDAFPKTRLHPVLDYAPRIPDLPHSARSVSPNAKGHWPSRGLLRE